MNKLLQLLLVTSLINAYPDIPDELTGEMLKDCLLYTSDAADE